MSVVQSLEELEVVGLALSEAVLVGLDAKWQFPPHAVEARAQGRETNYPRTRLLQLAVRAPEKQGVFLVDLWAFLGHEEELCRVLSPLWSPGLLKVGHQVFKALTSLRSTWPEVPLFQEPMPNVLELEAMVPVLGQETSFRQLVVTYTGLWLDPNQLRSDWGNLTPELIDFATKCTLAILTTLDSMVSHYGDPSDLARTSRGRIKDFKPLETPYLAALDRGHSETYTFEQIESLANPSETETR